MVLIPFLRRLRRVALQGRLASPPLIACVVFLLIPCYFILLGVHGDVNGTYPVGTIDEESKKLIRTTRKCLDEAIKICKPGALFREIGKVMFV